MTIQFIPTEAEMLKEPTERVWGYPYADIVMGCHMANPSNLSCDGDRAALSSESLFRAGQ